MKFNDIEKTEIADDMLTLCVQLTSGHEGDLATLDLELTDDSERCLKYGTSRDALRDGEMIVKCLSPESSTPANNTAKKKRYLLFAGDMYYPSGGMKDFEGAFDSVQEAIDSLDDQYFAHILDIEHEFVTWDKAIGHMLASNSIDDYKDMAI